MNRQRIYWQVFNILGRFVGAGFTLVGGVFVLWGVSLLLDRNATFSVDGIQSSDPWTKSVVLAAGLGVVVLGIMLLKSKRYRPDLGDSPFSCRSKDSDERPQVP